MHTLRCYVNLQLHRYLKSCQKDLQLNGCFLPKNVPLSLVCFLVLMTLINQKHPLYLPGNKLYKKIIKKCWKIADQEGVDLCQTYVRVNKKKA